jgi:selenium metabolism protein YedF
MVEVNCLGQKCPLPLISTKKALLAHPNEDLAIIVDNETSCNNLKSYLTDNGISFTVAAQNETFTIYTGKGEMLNPLSNPSQYCSSTSDAGFIVVFDRCSMGDGDASLGAILLKGFLTALSENEQLPLEVICYNSGVLLADSQSEFSEYFKKIERLGVKITLCGTCVDFYGIKERLAAGSISNMMYILNKLSSAAKVIKP